MNFPESKPYKDRILIPALIWMLSRASLHAVARWVGLNPFQASTWIRRDSGHYLSIAKDGYQLFLCQEISGTPPGDWCGNAGWFPAYSWLLRLVKRVAGTPETAGVLLSAMFSFAILFLLWNYFFAREPRREAVFGLILAAFFPGAIYFHAVFPISLCVLCMFIYLMALENRHWFLVALSGYWLGLSYPTGCLLPLICAAVVPGSWKHRLLSALPPTLGLLTLFSSQQVSTGAWNAFFLVQAKYRLPQLWPFETIFTWLAPLSHPHYPWWRLVAPTQTVTALALCLWAAWGWSKRRSKLPNHQKPFENALVLLMTMLFLLPYAFPSRTSFYRAEALLLPSVVLLRPHKSSLSKLFVFIICPLSLLMASMFFRDWLN